MWKSILTQNAKEDTGPNRRNLIILTYVIKEIKKKSIFLWLFSYIKSLLNLDNYF